MRMTCVPRARRTRSALLEGPKRLRGWLGLGREKAVLPVGERDAGAGGGERDGRLERGVAAADDEDVLSGEVLRVVEPVEDLVELLAGHAEPAVRAAPPDRDDHAAGLGRGSRAPGVVEHDPVAPALDPLDARGRDLDSGLPSLPLEVGEELLPWDGPPNGTADRPPASCRPGTCRSAWPSES